MIELVEDNEAVEGESVRVECCQKEIVPSSLL